MVSDTSRGQAYTLEALVSALLLLGTIVFALQATAVTPQSASTADAHSQAQLERVAGGVLDAARERGAIRATVLYWDNAEAEFHGLGRDQSAYENGALPTAFGAMLNESFGDHAVVYNVDVRYYDQTGAVQTRTVLDSGTPSDDAARVTALVTLYDDDVLYLGDETESTRPLSNATFYAPDSSPASGLYNVVTVEVVLWTT